ncbi:MAG: Hsp20/alpha crystallin family protein [Nitriliruptoraceae bacterium]
MNRLLPRTHVQPSLPESYAFDEFHHLREQLLAGLPHPHMRPGAWSHALADLEEHEDAFLVEVEVPGFDRDDLSIEMEGRRLIVQAEREEPERRGILRSSTRKSGLVRHEVVLPAAVDEEAIEASLARGVLSIRLPKTETAGRRRIEIA